MKRFCVLLLLLSKISKSFRVISHTKLLNVWLFRGGGGWWGAGGGWWIHTTMSLEHKNCWRYEHELHTITNGVCKLYVKAKMKRFAQNMLISYTCEKFRRNYDGKMSNYHFWGTALIQRYFQITDKHQTCRLRHLTMSLWNAIGGDEFASIL